MKHFNKFLFAVFVLIISIQCSAQEKLLKFYPIQHATFVIEAGDLTIYVDPVEPPAKFARFSDPDIILITHIHSDHMNKEIVNQLKTESTIIIGPKSVSENVSDVTVMNNGDVQEVAGIKIEAIPAYNLTEDRLNFHPQGRDNGYILNIDGKRIYLSGDTEDIPEMRALKNIDHAFICMNLPWTMNVEQAASGVLAFKPKAVTPYHYRGQEGMSDLRKFQELVSKDKSIKVEIMDFYK